MKKILIGILIIFLTFSLLVFITFLFSLEKSPKKFVNQQKFESEENFFYKIEKTRFPAYFGITSNRSKIGLAVEPFMLQFGIVPPNISAKKIIIIKNSNKVPVKIRAKSYGNISTFLTFEFNEIILKPFENRNLTIKASGEKVGNYSGEVQIITKIPKNWWSEWLLFLV